MRISITIATLVIICSSCSNIDKPHVDNKLSEKSYPYFDWMIERSFPDEELNYKTYIKAKQAVSKQSLNSVSKAGGFNDAWTTQGPGNIGARVNTVAVNPENPNIIYAGFSGGGIYKTENGGDSWMPIFDENAFLAVGDIQIDPNNTDVIYLATGDPNVSGLPSIGNGLFRSEDAGESWEYMGLEENRILSKIEIHPDNQDILFVASMGLPFTYNTTRGIFRSLDAGKSWEQVLSVSDSTGFTNVIVNPGNPQYVYASSWDRVRSNSVNLASGSDSGIYMSSDGGEQWSRITTGLPIESSSRTGIEVCRDFPNNVYAVVINSDFDLGGIYRSTDFGQSFNEVKIDDLPDNVMGGFGWYFGKLFVNPVNPEHIFILGVDMYETRDGGETWEQSVPNWWTNQVHADKHDLQFTDNGQIYLATDGGIYQRHIDSTSWDDIESIPTTQFYRVAYNPHEPNTYYGGAQDNGTPGGNAENIEAWSRIFGGDGFQMTFNPTDPLHYFVETQRGGISYTIDGGDDYNNGQRGLEGPRDWDMQYIMSTHDPLILYTGTDRVFMATNSYDVEWFPISEKLTSDMLVGDRDPNITCISESPLAAGVIYVGTNDGQVWGTKNLGASWEFLAADLPLRYVTEIKASPDFEGTAYVSFSGYKDNDNLPRIYKTSDFGENWESISSNLPDIAINDLLIVPGTQDLQLFVATEAGVYGTIDGGLNWDRLGNNMPNVTVYDLEINVENNELIAGTFGRSIMTYPLDGLGEVSNESINIFEIKVFPNPSSDYLNIDFQNESTANLVKIFDNRGLLKLTKALQGNQERIDISDFPVGTYYLNIDGQTHKFIKI